MCPGGNAEGPAIATPTKTARTLQASASNAAAGTTTATTWDLRTAYGGFLQGRITNGATGPTIGCDMRINTSVDGSTWREALGRQTAGVANNGVYDFGFDVPPGVMYVQVVFTGNTAQAVTVEAYGHEITSIG